MYGILHYAVENPSRKHCACSSCRLLCWFRAKEKLAEIPIWTTRRDERSGGLIGTGRMWQLDLSRAHARTQKDMNGSLVVGVCAVSNRGGDAHSGATKYTTVSITCSIWHIGSLFISPMKTGLVTPRFSQ